MYCLTKRPNVVYPKIITINEKKNPPILFLLSIRNSATQDITGNGY